MTYRADIQILRAIAVLLVLFYHLKINGFENGFLGVDIFFVLSGYLMAKLYDKNTIKEFYTRRFKRIFPAYLLTISLTTFAVAFVASPADFSQRFDRIGYDLFGLSNFAFWLENSYFDHQNFKPLLNIWSLGVELQYYLIVPFILPIVRKKKIYLFLLISFSILLAFLITTISSKTSFFMMPLRIWEFLIGAYVAWYSAKNKIEDKIFFPMMAIILFVTVFLFYPIDTRSVSIYYGHPGIASVIIVLITAVILKYPISSKIILKKNILSNLLIKIGDYSYSIYLVHFPVIVIFNYEPFEGTNLHITSYQNYFLIIFTTIVISILMFNFIESKRYKNNFKNFFVVLILVSSCLIVSSKFVSNWKYQKFNLEEKLIFNAYFDQDSFRCGTIFRLKNPIKVICPINEIESSKKVLFLGDSHANSLKKTFANVMTNKKIAAYFYASNYPLMQSRQNEKIIFENIQKLEITNVIIHFNPKFYKNQNYSTQLDLLLNNLDKAKIKVEIISPIPTSQYHVPQILYKKTLGLMNNLEKKTLIKYFQENDPFFEFIKRRQIKNKNINLSHKFLCPNNINCLLEIDGKPLYFDSNHLTLTGSSLLNPIFTLISKKIEK
jgi:peptidoglycan/LPS O-acetylase OafA/YrhL